MLSMLKHILSYVSRLTMLNYMLHDSGYIQANVE